MGAGGHLLGDPDPKETEVSPSARAEHPGRNGAAPGKGKFPRSWRGARDQVGAAGPAPSLPPAARTASVPTRSPSIHSRAPTFSVGQLLPQGVGGDGQHALDAPEEHHVVALQLEEQRDTAVSPKICSSHGGRGAVQIQPSPAGERITHESRMQVKAEKGERSYTVGGTGLGEPSALPRQSSWNQMFTARLPPSGTLQEHHPLGARTSRLGRRAPPSLSHTHKHKHTPGFSAYL